MHHSNTGRAFRLLAGVALSASAALFVSCATVPAPPPAPGIAADEPELATQVEIRRTTYGVPQITAENLRAAAFALAYVQLEDHGSRILEGMHAARGRMALVQGARRVDADARARLIHQRAAESYHLLGFDTREVYEGFAAGMNHFIHHNPDAVPGWVEPDYTAIDVLARDITWPSEGAINAFRRRLEADPGDARLLAFQGGSWQRSASSGVPRGSREFAAIVEDDQNVGSNAWALAPGRTSGGGAMLMRNPHLSWSAGYYEAHLRVPGKLDFYGDFRIGGPFTVIGGFNSRLGFSTTNNEQRIHEYYAFRADPDRPDHYLLDGESHPLIQEVVDVEFIDNGETGVRSREFWSTEYGPVIERNDSLVYIYRSVNAGDYRAGEQWLEMMKATTFEEWYDVMRMGARMTSNFTYADADGNIFYASVQGAPLLPHPVGGDTVAILATASDQIWSEQVPFDALPQLLNPPGGYVRNENDSPHYTNLNAVMEHDFPDFWVQEPRLRMRSQHGIMLLHNDSIFSLEDAVETKHSMRMILADRVKDDLVAAVRASGAGGEVARATDLLEQWDNTVAAESRGGVLFEAWWNEYRDRLDGAEPFAVTWSPEELMTTPRGIADPAAAAEAFPAAVATVAQRYGGWNVAWGDVHRVRYGDVDVPVGGCAGALGCFRVLAFSTAPDGKRVVDGGDGWVITVQFDDDGDPRGYSVLAYGQSPNPDSPYHDNQAALFAANEMKPILWTEADIEGAIRERYRPGEEAGR